MAWKVTSSIDQQLTIVCIVLISFYGVNNIIVFVVGVGEIFTNGSITWCFLKDAFWYLSDAEWQGYGSGKYVWVCGWVCSVFYYFSICDYKLIGLKKPVEVTIGVFKHKLKSIFLNKILLCLQLPWLVKYPAYMLNPNKCAGASVC